MFKYNQFYFYIFSHLKDKLININYISFNIIYLLLLFLDKKS